MLVLGTSTASVGCGYVCVCVYVSFSIKIILCSVCFMPKHMNTILSTWLPSFINKKGWLTSQVYKYQC